MTTVTAPGKLFLFGEYAVLRGAPAIVTTVSRRVRARSIDDGYRLLGADADLALPDAVADVAGRPVPPLEVDIRELFEGETKIGFGSSAASAVVLTAATLGSNDPAVVTPIAHRAHRQFQGGKGSGGDVAASAYGGTVVVRPSEDPDEAPSVQQLEWPEDLDVFVVWTQKSADTRQFVDAVNRQERPLSQMKQLAEAAVTAFEAKDVERLLVIAHDYDDAMGKLGASAGVPIRTNLQRRISKTVRDFGATAKPSGAGGGDVSLIFARRGLDRDGLAASLPGEATLLDVDLAVPGVRGG